MNITNTTNTTDKGDQNDSNEVSYAIFVLLFAIFAIFLILGIFFFLERLICKNKKKIKNCFSLFLKIFHIMSRKPSVRPLSTRKKRVHNSEIEVSF